MEDAEGVARNKILVGCLSEMEINLVTSQPLLQGMVAQIPLSKIAVPDVFNLASRHLQLIRSVPSRSLLTTLVGMKQRNHVSANLEVIKKAPLTR